MVERWPGPREQGYMIDFFGPGYDAAEAMGALPRLRERAYPVEATDWLDDRGRLTYEQFAKIVCSRLLSLMRPDLEAALRERLPDGVDLRYLVVAPAAVRALCSNAYM